MTTSATAPPTAPPITAGLTEDGEWFESLEFALLGLLEFVLPGAAVVVPDLVWIAAAGEDVSESVSERTWVVLERVGTAVPGEPVPLETYGYTSVYYSSRAGDS